MNRDELKKVMSYRSYPCVSIIAPTHKTKPDNKQDPIKIKNLVKEAVTRLNEEFPHREIRPIIEKIESIVSSIDYTRAGDSIAIYACKDFSAGYDLPVNGKEQVVIDETFATRNLVYAIHKNPRYLVLALSEKPTRLFDIFLNSPVEIINDNFPAFIVEDENSAPRPTGEIVNMSSYKEEQYSKFFKKIDKALGAIIKDTYLPVVVTGVERNLAYYRDVTELKDHIVGEIKGSHDKSSPFELARLTWPVMRNYMAEKKTHMLQKLEDSIGNGHYASGIDQVWSTAFEGRGAILLVEEEFQFPAVINEDNQILSPAEDSTSPGIVDDAVDEIIEEVINRGGQVFFVDKDDLRVHNRIAMILRY
jgi:hypothetical protein